MRTLPFPIEKKYALILRLCRKGCDYFGPNTTSRHCHPPLTINEAVMRLFFNQYVGALLLFIISYFYLTIYAKAEHIETTTVTRHGDTVISETFRTASTYCSPCYKPVKYMDQKSCDKKTVTMALEKPCPNGQAGVISVNRLWNPCTQQVQDFTMGSTCH